MSNGMSRERKFNLWGWLLFIVCAIFFIASAAVNGDMLYLVGSIVLLLACLIFIFPLVIKRIKEKGD